MTTKTEKKKGKKSKEVRRIGFEADDYLVVAAQDGKSSPTWAALRNRVPPFTGSRLIAC